MIQKTPQLEILKNLVVRAPSQFLGIVRKSAVLLFGLEISAISLMPLGIPDLISSLVDTYRSLKMIYQPCRTAFQFLRIFRRSAELLYGLEKTKISTMSLGT